MATNAQIEANKKNAARSTGPRTQKGKDASRLNAVRHGLLAATIVLRDEDPQEFEDLRNDLVSELEPEGALETLLVDRVAVSAWRLRRVLRIEKGVITRDLYDDVARRAREQAMQPSELTRALRRAVQDRMLAPTSEAHEASRKLERKRVDALEEAALEAEAIRDGSDLLLGRAFVVDAVGPDALTKLSRYEAAIERTLFRALAELREVQATRRERPHPPAG